jgi:EAL and modified HD-GYP domain-containing signal transduction protein
MSDTCLVRQPVFGTSGALIGYEIRFGDTDAEQRALIQSLSSGTFELVRGRQPAFVACGRDLLLQHAPSLVNPATAVLMFPRSLDPTPDVIEAILRFKDAGGHIALDQLGSVESLSEQLLPYATWARIDVSTGDLVELAQRVGHLIRQRAGLKVIGYNVSERAQYDAIRALGAEAFQGQFFSSPEPVPATDMPQNTVAAMRLMGLARDPNVNDRTLEEVLATDPVLMFQLLRLVNSASVGLRGVSSIGQALRMIGRTTFERWLAVAVAASRKSTTGVDQELVRKAIERGRLLEQLSGGPRDSGTLFLVGLFSALDAVFRMSLPEILERVTLSDEATSALLDRSGPYSDALSFVEAYELGMFEHAAELASEMGVDPSRLGELYTNALTWTDEALGNIAPPPTEKAAPKVVSGRGR